MVRPPKKHSMVMVSSKTIENLQWSLQRDQREEKQRRNESKAITNFFRPHAISKPDRKEIDEAVIDYFIARSEPFRAVEDHFFRQMVYRMHRGYTLKLMSEMELARKIDAKIETVKEFLSREIQEDVKIHKSVALTSDGGTSGDQNKTKKNTLTLSRINENWEMKTDTIAFCVQRSWPISWHLVSF